MVNIKNIIIGIAILILTIFVAVYGISMIYEAPDWDDYCGEKSTGAVETEAECLFVGGKWNSYDVEIPKPVGTDDEGWCDIDYECREEYDVAREKYHKTIFLITLPLGIILIIVGVLVFGLEIVGAGLAGGGVGIMLWGIGGYWQYGSNLMKFLLSLVGLVAVIFLAYWFNKKK